MKLHFLATTYSICQLNPTDAVPKWANGFLSISRTADELTIIVESECVPDGIKAEHDFAGFRVVGKIAFDVIGVIAAISQVLAAANIPIFAISTYDTDYFLISRHNVELTQTALKQSGHEIV